jgi:glycine cleavage system H protein
MSDQAASLVFMMGEFKTEFPRDRFYITNHMWAIEQSPGCYRFGLTAYAVRLLQDVYFLDWTVDAPTLITNRQQIGSIESKKAESDIYAPAAGKLIAFNPETLDDPTAINVDPYGDGWLLEIESQTVELLTTEAYIEHLAVAWKVAERTIKGQIQ